MRTKFLAQSDKSSYETDVCIVGGGPAGMILGLLLAHQGIKVMVVESHKDFEREYRGEVLMPRFTQMMKQVGLFSYLEKYPHLKLKNFELHYKNHVLAKLNFSNFSPDAPFAIWMPQPVMLNALYDKAKTYPNFQLLFGVMARDVLRKDKKVVGVKATHREEEIEIHSRVTVGADGRTSAVRKAANFEMEYEDYDFDLIWFTVKRDADYVNTVRAFFSPQRTYIVLPKYPDLVQCGLIVPKGEFLKFREKGIVSIQKEILSGHSLMHDFARNLKDFSPFSVLQARVSYVKKWAKDGCLLIGDAAHTCSPVGAIGVSVAVATAIVAADVLTQAFKENDLSVGILDKVQEIRAKEVKHIQALQARFINVAVLNSRYLRWFSFINIFLLAKTGLLQKFQRQIAVMDRPLPVKINVNNSN